MPHEYSRLEKLLKQPYVPAASPDLAARIIAAAHGTHQRPFVSVEHIVPALFQELGFSAPLFMCISLLICGFLLGLASPTLYDFTDTLAHVGGLIL